MAYPRTVSLGSGSGLLAPSTDQNHGPWPNATATNFYFYDPNSANMKKATGTTDSTWSIVDSTGLTLGGATVGAVVWSPGNQVIWLFAIDNANNRYVRFEFDMATDTWSDGTGSVMYTWAGNAAPTTREIAACNVTTLSIDREVAVVRGSTVKVMGTNYERTVGVARNFAGGWTTTAFQSNEQINYEAPVMIQENWPAGSNDYNAVGIYNQVGPNDTHVQRYTGVTDTWQATTVGGSALWPSNGKHQGFFMDTNATTSEFRMPVTGSPSSNVTLHRIQRNNTLTTWSTQVAINGALGTNTGNQAYWFDVNTNTFYLASSDGEFIWYWTSDDFGTTWTQSSVIHTVSGDPLITSITVYGILFYNNGSEDRLGILFNEYNSLSLLGTLYYTETSLAVGPNVSFGAFGA